MWANQEPVIKTICIGICRYNVSIMNARWRQQQNEKKNSWYKKNQSKKTKISMRKKWKFFCCFVFFCWCGETINQGKMFECLPFSIPAAILIYRGWLHFVAVPSFISLSSWILLEQIFLLKNSIKRNGFGKNDPQD